MSLDASGTLGKAVTFSKWKGRNYVRERVIPSNPKSGGQVGRRAMFTFLSQAWDALTDGAKATWQDLADQLVALPFNAYISYNMQRWHNFAAPTQGYPTTESTNGSDRALSAAVWEENRIKLSTTATTANQQWGIVYFAKLAGAVTPSVGNAIIAELDLDVANRDTFWTPPSVGTWHFNSIATSDDGVKETAGGAVNAVP
ncbi:unnamed protein product [marine sediment metagenome]|uniref:Uncharacterized protein n=1 Tax=marine sediment metagenome TaxID=412755 RepID=X1EGR1_9ZZZZ